MFRNWQHLRTRQTSQPARRISRARSRLWLEFLEDRTVLSTINWKSAVSGGWNDATKWDSGTVPTGSDDAVISFSGITVTHFAGTNAINSLTSSANLVVSGGSLSFSTGSTIGGALTVSAGTLGGAGDVTVSGLVTWSGGKLTGAGHLKALGGLSIDGTAALTLNGESIDNGGTATRSAGTGVISASNGATFNNLSAGELNLQDDNFIHWTGTGAVDQITNAGTLNKTGGTGNTRFDGAFTNSGTVNVQSGTLELFGGGSGAGSFAVSSGARLLFDSGTYLLQTGAAGTGTGTFEMSGGTVEADGDTTFQSLLLDGATLTGSADVRVSGQLTWSGGTMAGSGHTRANGPSAVSGGGTLSGRTFDNAGISVWTSPSTDNPYLNITSGGVWNNLAGSTVDLQSDGALASDGSAGNAFNNAGTLRKSVGTNANTHNSGISVPFHNNFGATGGAVNVLAGRLDLGGSSAGGSYTVASGADLGFGNAQLDAATSISGAGTVGFGGEVDMAGSYSVSSTRIDGGTANFTGPAASTTTLDEEFGTLEGSADFIVSGQLAWYGGTMAGSGHTRANGPSTIDKAYIPGPTLSGRIFDNAGSSVWTDFGSIFNIVFTMDSGAIWNNLPGSTVEMQYDGIVNSHGSGNAINNAGTFKRSEASFLDSAYIFPAFHNNIGTTPGTVIQQVGGLAFLGGGSSTGGRYSVTGGTLVLGGTQNLDGSTSITGAGTVRFTGTANLDSTTSISSSGTVILGAQVNLAGSYNVTGSTAVSGGTANFLGTVISVGSTLTISGGTANFNTSGVSVQTLDFSGGTLTSSADVTVSGQLTWSGGTMTGSGHTRANGPSAISQDPALVGRTFDNAGTSVWTTTNSYYFALGTGAVWNNLAGSTVDMQTDGIVTSDGSTGNAVNNAGTVKKSAGTAVSEIQAPFTDMGTLDVQKGRVYLSGGLTNLVSGTLTSGTYLVTSTLQINGTNITTNAAAITLSGTNSKVLNNAGTNAIGGLNTNATAGRFSLQNGRTFTATGAFTNTGAVLIDTTSALRATGQYRQKSGSTTVLGTLTGTNGVSVQGGTLGGSGTVSGNVNNGGTVAPGTSPGVLTLSGNYTQSAAGTLAIEVGGTTAGSGYDRLAVSGTFSLAGTLALSTPNSFVPAAGDTFQVVTGSAVSGSFTTITGTGLPNGESFKVNLDPADVTLGIRVLAASGVPFNSTEGTSFSGTMATFTTTDSSQPASDFTAQVVWGDGQTSVGSISGSAGSFSVSAGHTYAAEGTYAVSVTVSDTHWGSASTASSTAYVANATGQNISGQEATSTGTVTLATFTNLGGPEPVSDYGATIAWGDGASDAGTLVANGDGSFSVQGSHTYADNGSYTIAVHITEVHGLTADTSSTAMIANVPPTAGISGSGDGVPGQTLSYSFSASDPSPVDQAAGFTFNVAWGDGTSSMVNGTSPQSLTHPYTAARRYTISLTATDKDGGISAAAIQTVLIVKAELQGSNLAVGGTPGSDSIVYAPGINAGDVVVTRNGTALGTFHPAGSIISYGNGGTDTVTVNGGAAADSFVILSAGSLTLNGSTYQGVGIAHWKGNGQGGNDTFTVQAGGVAAIDGGTGTNTLSGPNQTNAWVLPGPGAGSLNGRSFLNMQDLTGGSGTDTFKIKPSGGVTGTIDGGAGNNWLDYSAYTTAISVNLSGATYGTLPPDSATRIKSGAAGGVANIQNVSAGSGGATLVGGGGNIFVGGTGSDTLVDTYAGTSATGGSLLIGGKGADTLTAGTAGDILISGGTSFATKNTNLQDILNYWNSNSHSSAFTTLQSASGLPGTGERLVWGSTVTNDGNPDVLNGTTTAGAIDWFFAGVEDNLNNAQHGTDYRNNGLY